MSEEIVGQFIDRFLAGDQLGRTYLVDGWRQQSLLVVDVSTVEQGVVTF